MTEYVHDVHITRQTWKRWRKLLKISDMERQKERAKGLGAQPDDVITLASVTFDDGASVMMSLVSGQTNYYVNTEIIDANEQLILDGIEPTFDLTPQMIVDHNDTRYILNFVCDA